MTKPITDDPNTLAAVITELGGTVIPGPTFRFELPLSEVRTVIPKINELGVGVRKISEYQTDDPKKLFSSMSIATLELYHPQEKPEGELREAWFKR